MSAWRAAVAVALCVATARADVVHLKDGGRLEGKVVAEEKGSVTLETPLGRMAIERSRIAKIEKGLLPREELEQREKALPKDAGAAQWFELAEFAAAKGLKREHERLLDAVLQRDPEHAGANLARGRVRHDGRWMKPAERDAAVKAAQDAAMRAQGLVDHEGRWVTPEEKEHLLRGDVLVGGRWLSADDARRAQGFERLGDDWVHASELIGRRRAAAFAQESGLALHYAAGEHVLCASSFGQPHAETLRDAGEKGYAIAAKALRETPADLAWIGGAKVLALVVDSRDEFGRFTRCFARDERKVDSRWAEGVAKVDGFYWFDPNGTSATFRGARHLDDTVAHTVHHLGHVFLNRHGFNWKFLPTWLDEGFAAWLEHRVLGRNAISCIAGRRYGSSGTRKDDLVMRPSWFDDAVKAVREGKDPLFPPILKRDLSTIEPEEVAKAMVVIDWMIDARPDGFLKLLAALRDHWPKGVVSPMAPETARAHEQAFAALGVPAALLDAELRKSIAARPAPARK
ncbi:MAG: hypothetical protein FJ293_10680 [Planctomycetes bacterium]|nr:hypothetical protein [Planctomycetota bacterium]